MKHHKLLSGLILTGLLLLICLTGSTAAADPDLPEITLSSGFGFTGEIGTGSSFTYTPSESGTYTYLVEAYYEDPNYAIEANGGPLTVIDVLEPSATPRTLILGGSVDLTVNDTGYSSVLWEVSKDGGEWSEVDTGQTVSYTPEEAGTYNFRVTANYAGGLTQTVNVDWPVNVVGPSITVTPKRGNLTTEFTLTAKDIVGYTDFLWQVSKDGGAFTDVGATNPYSYVPGEEGEYLYRVILSAEDMPDYTITAEEPVEIIDGELPGTAPISTAAFYIAAVFFVLLFMAGLYFVYNDNVFGFIASGFAVLCSWALMALSAFGRVGDTHMFYNETTGEIVKQVLFIDPAMVFILTFACIIMTIVYIVILVRFIAQLALLKNYNPEEEEEEEQ